MGLSMVQNKDMITISADAICVEGQMPILQMNGAGVQVEGKNMNNMESIRLDEEFVLKTNGCDRLQSASLWLSSTG